METAMLIIGIILLVFAVFLVVAVLMQQGKAHNLSGAIAGGAETFFGKTKGQTINKKLSILTTIVAIVFVLIVCTVYVIQPSSESLSDYDSFWDVINPFSENEPVVEHDHDGDGVADHDASAHEDAPAVEHDHDGDGVADHDASAHEDAAEGADAADTTAAVEHDHDGDGVADHAADDHVDESADSDAAVEETTAA